MLGPGVELGLQRLVMWREMVMMLGMEVGVGGGRRRGSRRRSFFGLVCNRSSGWESFFIISQVINGVG